MNMDDAYTQFAATRRAAEAQEKSSSSGSKWVKGDFTGFDTDIPKPIRFLGNAPIAGIPSNKGDAKILNIAELKDDSGKNTRIIVPPRSECPDHIFWKIVGTVTKKNWDDRLKKFVNTYELTYPEIWNKVVKGGYQPTEAKFKFAKGWKGKEVIIANVIDRTRMDWHRANKKALLTAKTITEATNQSKPDETITFVDEGLPTYPLLNADIGCLTKMFSSYGNWNNYDIMLTRHNTTQNSWEASNASSSKAIAYNLAKAAIGHEPTDDEVTQLMSTNSMVADACKSLAGLGRFVSTTPLTDEEKSWELTDISELRPYTSFTSIKYKVGKTIARIDACLGTHYVEELDALVAKEQAQKASEAPEASVATQPVANPVTATPVPTPVTPTTAATSQPVVEATQPRVINRVEPKASTGLSSEKAQLIPYWDKLTAQEQAWILDVTLQENGKPLITFDSAAGALIDCDPSCGYKVPASFTSCPYCGAMYA